MLIRTLMKMAIPALCATQLYAYTGVSQNFYSHTNNVDTYKQVNYNFTAVSKDKRYTQKLCDASFPTSIVFTENSLFHAGKQRWVDWSPENPFWRLKSQDVFRTYINNQQTLISGSFSNKFKYKKHDYFFTYSFAEVTNKRNNTIKGVIWNKYCKIHYQKILLHRELRKPNHTALNAGRLRD